MEWTPGASVLQNQVRIVRDSEAAQQVSPIGSVTIDIVAMLFDFVFNDDELPATVKSLVGQLQIPVLKVAMLDQSFFGNRQHPARRSRRHHRRSAALGPAPTKTTRSSAAGTAGYPHPAGIETNVEIFRKRSANSRDLRHRARGGGNSHARSRRRRWSSAGKRRRSCERVQAAPAAARVPQPEVVRQFIADQWAAVPRQKALTHEAEHPSWHDTIEVAEQLIWSVAAKARILTSGCA